MRFRTFLSIALLMLTGWTSTAAANQSFADWLADLRAEAQAKGIAAGTLDTAFADVAPIPRVIELDRKQPESRLTFQQYIERVVPQSRIDRGIRRYQENRALLEQVGRQFGVQPRFIVALWGIETDFGRNTGGFSVIASLATLAHDGRRAAFFRNELLNALQILDQGHIAAADMKGSWAGAMGQPQFMPSSFMRFAVDQNDDGRRDIWQTRADVFASAANYLAESGWDDRRTWGRKVQLPKGFDANQSGLEVVKTLAEWQSLGIRKVDGSNLPTVDIDASLIFPQRGATSPAYLIYKNYRTILKWNRSHYFAMAVGYLSDSIRDGL